MDESLIIQLNTSEISDDARTALEKYFNENKPKIIALNETRKTLDTY